MSGKTFDAKAKKRLARHIIGGDKQEQAEKDGVACPECGVKGCKGDCETGEAEATNVRY